MVGILCFFFFNSFLSIAMFLRVTEEHLDVEKGKTLGQVDVYLHEERRNFGIKTTPANKFPEFKEARRISSFLASFKILRIMECNITLTRGGMYWKLRPPRTERFAEVLILHPEAREIARGRSPRAISRAEGCKINAEANLEVRGGRNFQWIPTLVSVITFFFPRRGCFDFSFWPAHCVL